MNWYYVDNGKQAGPVDDLQLQQLAGAGVIRLDTLVWREGMANWQPYSQAVPAGSGASSPPPTATPVLGPDEVICAECRQVFPRQDTIAYGTVNVCAGCKPVFLQKLTEGVTTGVRRGRRTLPVDADGLIAEIQSRGYQINIGSCVSRGWELVKANFWLVVGATFLVTLCQQAGGFVPFLGPFISLALYGPLMGGLNIFLLKVMRGERAELGDAFSGFSSAFGRLCGTFLLMILAIYAMFVPGGIPIGIAIANQSAPGVFAIILIGLGFLACIYLAIAFSFALVLSADLQLGPVKALRVSMRIVNMKWFTVFGLMIVAGLVNVLGFLACIIGLLVTMPIFHAAILYAYEDIFGEQN